VVGGMGTGMEMGFEWGQAAAVGATCG